MNTLTKAQITADSLNLDPGASDENDLFCWLVASFLSGKRIQQEIALSAYRVIVDVHQITSVKKMAALTHRQLVSMLGEGRYVRYDESTATRLSALCRKLIEQYEGKVSEIIKRSTDAQDLSKRLQEFDGIGPKTAEIFLREIPPSQWTSGADQTR